MPSNLIIAAFFMNLSAFGVDHLDLPTAQLSEMSGNQAEMLHLAATRPRAPKTTPKRVVQPPKAPKKPTVTAGRTTTTTGTKPKTPVIKNNRGVPTSSLKTLLQKNKGLKLDPKSTAAALNLNFSAKRVLPSAIDPRTKYKPNLKTHPPHNPTKPAHILTMKKRQDFVRVYRQGSSSEKKGDWLMNKKTFEKLKHDPKKLAQVLGLQHPPTHYANVSVGPGQKMSVSIANKVEAWGRSGGAFQYHLHKHTNVKFENGQKLPVAKK